MKDLLGVTGDGLGGAAESRWRPDRILSKRAVNLIGTAAGAAGVVLLGLNLLLPANSSKSDAAWADVPPTSAASFAPSAPAPIPATASLPVSTPPAAVTPSLRTYAIAMSELSGLPPDVAPGTTVEIWATWDSGQGMPGFQKVVDSALVERIAPPFLEGASPVVLLQMGSKREFRDLVWAHRYGTLAAVLLPQPAPVTYPSPYLP